MKHIVFVRVSTCARGGRAHVPRMVLFDGDSRHKLILYKKMCAALRREPHFEKEPPSIRVTVANF